MVIHFAASSPSTSEVPGEGEPPGQPFGEPWSVLSGGEGVLDFYGMTGQDKWQNLGWLLLICAAVSLFGGALTQLIDHSSR